MSEWKITEKNLFENDINTLKNQKTELEIAIKAHEILKDIFNAFKNAHYGEDDISRFSEKSLSWLAVQAARNDIAIAAIYKSKEIYNFPEDRDLGPG